MVAIAADKVEDMTKLAATLPGITLLSDPALSVTTAWKLRKGDNEHPEPGTYVVKSGGAITFSHAGKEAEWPTLADVLAAL